MLLQDALLDFYGSIAPLAKCTYTEAMARWPQELATLWLNQGMAHAAEDCGGIEHMSKHTLTADEPLYSLSAAALSTTTIISLKRVILLDTNGTDVKVTLNPQDATNMEMPDAVLTSGTPSRCSWKIQKHDSATAIYELRLDPPPNWTRAAGLVVICSVRPAEITTGTDSFDVLDTMARMGVAWAKWQATRAPTFLQDYSENKRLFGKSGLNNFPISKRRFLRRPQAVDPRLDS